MVIFKDDQILLVVSPIYNYGSYSEFKAVNGAFDEDEYHYISENYLSIINAIQFEYEVEEPRYHAKIKGHELVYKGYNTKYWILDNNKNLFIDELPTFGLDTTGDYIDITRLSIKEWNALGINETNADFEEVG